MNLSKQIRNAKAELDKVIFPTQGQVKQAYIAVIIVVSVIAAFLAVIDLIMQAVMSFILG